MTKVKTNTKTRPNPATATEIVSNKEARIRAIRGNTSRANLNKALTNLKTKAGHTFDAIYYPPGQLASTGEEVEQRSPKLMRSDKDNPVGAKACFQSGKSWKGRIKETGGRKISHFVHISFVRKVDGVELEKPTAMISIDGQSRVPLESKHEVMFGLS